MKRCDYQSKFAVFASFAGIAFIAWLNLEVSFFLFKYLGQNHQYQGPAKVANVAKIETSSLNHSVIGKFAVAKELRKVAKDASNQPSLSDRSGR